MSRMVILSLGAGVQSTTVLLLSCYGLLPKIDHAIFADTGWEPRAVYKHLDWLSDISQMHDIPIHRVTAGNIKDDALNAQVRGTKAQGVRWVSMPYYTVTPNGKRGMIRRQCTREYKIDPIEKYIRRSILNLKARQRAPRECVIDLWFGISSDESQRMRISPDRFRRYCYPLIGMPDVLLDKRWRRSDCHAWLREHYPNQYVPRSACVGCPYHSNAEWRWLRDEAPYDWQQAVEFDRRIRNCGGVRGKMYLHNDAIPLEQVDLSTTEDHGQINMFINECEGMCGV